MPLLRFQRKFSGSHIRENNFRIFAKNCLQKYENVDIFLKFLTTQNLISHMQKGTIFCENILMHDILSDICENICFRKDFSKIFVFEKTFVRQKQMRWTA